MPLLWVSNQRFAYCQSAFEPNWTSWQIRTKTVRTYITSEPEIRNELASQSPFGLTQTWLAQCGKRRLHAPVWGTGLASCVWQHNQVSSGRRWGGSPTNDVRFSNSHIALMANCGWLPTAVGQIKIFKRNRRWRLLQLANSKLKHCCLIRAEQKAARQLHWPWGKK